MSVGKQYFSCLLLLTLLLTVSSCNINKGQPVSGGKPYEVVVVGDQDSIVTKTLRAQYQIWYRKRHHSMLYR